MTLRFGTMTPAQQEAEEMVRRFGLAKALDHAAALELEAIQRSPSPKWESENGHRTAVRRAIEDIVAYGSLDP